MAGNARNPNNDGTVERFDEEGDSVSKEDLLDGDGPTPAAKAASGGRIQKRQMVEALTRLSVNVVRLANNFD
ncbi:hypothetical protein F1880_000947 [Penicillium rolfsii]|nr:hypothetical protein F1880_000947 [Penicillium rolfsii]